MHKILTTHVCVGTLIGSGTGEGDELMATLVNHKTAHWQKRDRKRETEVSFTVTVYDTTLWPCSQDYIKCIQPPNLPLDRII